MAIWSLRAASPCSTCSWCGLCALVVAVAVAGKFGGSTLAARATGMSWREAGALGVPMNTRGLMELVTRRSSS